MKTKLPINHTVRGCFIDSVSVCTSYVIKQYTVMTHSIVFQKRFILCAQKRFGNIDSVTPIYIIPGALFQLKASAAVDNEFIVCSFYDGKEIAIPF